MIFGAFRISTYFGYSESFSDVFRLLYYYFVLRSLSFFYFLELSLQFSGFGFD